MALPSTSSFRWRTVDIVVASVIGVAFGVIFWAWGLLYNGPADAIPLPGRAFMYGVWLVPAVLGGLIIRKPGAALYTELLASAISLVLGTAWGWSIFWQGALQGAAAEVVFLLVAYRAFGVVVAMLAGTAAGLAASIFDIIVWYPASAYDTTTMRIPYVLITAVSSLLIAGIGGFLLSRALAQTGALDRFPSGRDRVAI